VPFLVGCAGRTPPPSAAPAQGAVAVPSAPALAVLDATLWMQTSGEYEALSRQTWDAAARLLPEALADTTWTAAVEQGSGAGSLPPAVIVDVDETVLDNSPYAARLIERDERFTEESWAEWVDEAKAKPIPGAVEFARRARALGVEVFYVTNRLANLEDATRRNLAVAGFPPGEAEDVVLMKNEREGWGSDKTSRRAYLAKHYRILLQAGDDLNDFVTGARGEGIDARHALVDEYGDMWGRRWIVLANPTYGSWMSAVLDGLESPTAPAELRRKLEALDPAEE
jgi:acid phosphatase